MVAGLAILSLGLLPRLKNAVSEMGVHPVVSSTVKSSAGFFFFDKLITIMRGAESGIVGGFSESLRGNNPYWFVWLVRSAVYGFISHKYGLRWRLYRRALGNVSRRPSASGWLPGLVSTGTRPCATAGSEPSSDAEGGRCQSSLVYKRVQNTNRPLAPSLCRAMGDDIVRLACEGAESPHPPEGGRIAGIPLRLAHQTSYHTIRGHTICKEKDCFHLGALAAGGSYYCPAHLPDAVTHKPSDARFVC